MPPLLKDPLEKFRFKAALASVRRDLEALHQLPQTMSDEEVERLWVRRRSVRVFRDTTVSRRAIGGLMASLERASRSPVQVYLWARAGRVEGLGEGMYYYHPARHALARITDSLDVAGRASPVNEQMFNEAGFGLLFLGAVEDIAPLYGDRALARCWMEVGRLCQALEEAASEHGCGICQTAGFRFAGLEATLRLEPGHQYLHAIVGGAMDWSAADRGWSFLGDAMPLAASVPQPADYERLLQAHCRKTLPESMVPVAFSIHEQFPLNANGKVDRAALARFGLARVSGGVPIAPAISPTLAISRTSEELVAIIAREAAAAFNLERVHPDAHFGELGVDSMMALRFRNRLERALECSLPAELAFNYPTVRSLATHLASEQTEDAASEVDVAALFATIPAEQLRASGLMEPLLALARSIEAAEEGEQPVDVREKTADEYLATASVMSEMEIAEKLDSMLGEIRHHG